MAEGISPQANMGVGGFADSSATNYGVLGNSYNTNNYSNGWNVGVYGHGALSNSVNVGVFARSNGTVSVSGNNYGVYADVTSVGTGINVGVYANATGGATNYAGYFNGNVTVMGVFSNPSDRRLKNNINPIESALSKIDRLNPVTYNYIKREGVNLPQNLQYGFIAQELESVLPELVAKQILPGVSLPPTPTANGSTPGTTAESFEFKGINYISIIPVLTQGIKEQQAIITEQNKKISDLESRLKALEEKSASGK